MVVRLDLAHAQSSDELYKKVFGKSGIESNKTKIDATLGDFFLGEVEVILNGESLQFISAKNLKDIIKEKIRAEAFIKYKLIEEMVDPSTLPFKVNYHPAELRVSLTIPPEDLKPSDANVYDDLIPYYSRKAEEPAPFSMAVNYKLEQTFNKNTNQQNYFSAYTDSSLNINQVSFENQMNYFSNRNKRWGRQSSKAIFDRPNRMHRYELGDVNFPIVGYLQGKSLGGVSFYRDFSLNPYRTVTPTSSFEYQIESRSLVRTFVNNILLKTEYMNPGRYLVKDIPLNNGINKIIVEITDQFGVTKTLTFNDSGSLDLLAEGVSRYAFSSGYESSELDGNRIYNNNEGLLTSGFYQHGLEKNWTTSAYAQGNKKFKLLGLNQIFSTGFGNLSHDLTGTNNKFNTGFVTQLTYQLNLFGAYWYDSHSLTSKLEYRSAYFNEVGENFKNRFNLTGTLSYSVPLFEILNLAVGGTYQNPTLAPNPRLSFNGSLTTKIFDSSSLTFYASRSRDEFKNWSNQMYFFFNMTFGESSTFASAFYERESQTKRLTLIRDNGKKYNDLKIAAVADQNKINKAGSLDLQYNTVLADIGARQEIINPKGGVSGYKTSLRYLSAFAFVYKKEDYAFSISRPIANSFIIFKPNKDWRDQKFGVQTSSGITEASTGLFGESLISSLTPYQYRRLQLDPSQLDPGYILGQESFVVYPRKNSGHLFVIGKNGFLVIKGKLLSQNKQAIGLKVGYWMSNSGKKIPFFTNREGGFLIEGIEAGVGTIHLGSTEEYRPLSLDLSNRVHGINDVGNLMLEEGEVKR